MDITSFISKNAVLETERLTLRRISNRDASDMFDYASRPITCRYLLWDAHPDYSYTVNYIKHIEREYDAGRYFDCAVVLKENGKMLGTVGFTSYDIANSLAEVGYVINPDYWGRGIAAEALAAVINFAFCELGVNRVEAKYISENTASLCVMEKCGMKQEGVLRQKMFIKGQYRDIGYCSILKSEYFAQKRESIYKTKEPKGVLSRIFHKN